MGEGEFRLKPDSGSTKESEMGKPLEQKLANQLSQ